MSYKTYFWLVLGIIAGGLLLTGLFDYIVDPLQFYRQAAFYPPSFSAEQRFQNPGLARNYEYDTITIGSSLIENTRPDMVDRILGGKTVKLAMSAASAYEERRMIELAIQRKPVKLIIWDLDFASLKGKPDRVLTYAGYFPYHLYDEDFSNDYKYLLSTSTARDSLLACYRLVRGIAPPFGDLNNLNTWDGTYVFSSEVMQAAWNIELDVQARGIKQYSNYDPSLAAMKASFDANVLPPVKNNPDVKFVIYYPPYSILRYRALYMEDPQLFYDELAIKSYIFQQLKAFPNAVLYDFQNDAGLTHNMNEYKDFTHHSLRYNELIIQAIADRDERYIVTEANLEPGIASLKEQVENLDEKALFE